MANPLTVIKRLGSGKSEFKGVVKRDWVPTGRIDFATKLDSNGDPNQPSEFKLLVEERRIIESVAGNGILRFDGGALRLKKPRSWQLSISNTDRKLAHQICIRPRNFSSGT
jgi:hypothetical protein